MNEVKVFVVKDAEGILRPQAGIWESSGAYGKAAKEEWEQNLSKKKYFRDCTLVEAILIENQ